MATGFQTTTSERYRLFRLVDGATASVAAPTSATSGVAMPKPSDGLQTLGTERTVLLIRSRAGTGTLNIAYAKIWGYVKDLDEWFPLGTGPDADRGKLNEGQAIGEVANDDLKLCEVIYDVMIFDRLAVELNTVGGTSPEIDVDLMIPRFLARPSKV